MRTFLTGRKDRLIQESRNDPYVQRTKPRSPAACTDCGVVFRDGRWAWDKAPAGAARTLCPACRRVAEAFPAGLVNLTGSYALAHRAEIGNLVGRTAVQETRRHPLERLMALRHTATGIAIETTGVHLARRIADAVARAHRGETFFHYGDGDRSVRIYWRRQMA